MNYKSIFLLLLFFTIATVSIAAGPPPPPSVAPPPPPGNGPPCWPPPCIPIDGGISLLMMAGAAYGAKKIYDSRKKDKAEN